MTVLDAALAARFMGLTLGHLGREYPHKLDHVLGGPDDAQTPAQLHPIFHGSFDWHSAFTAGGRCCAWPGSILICPKLQRCARARTRC